MSPGFASLWRRRFPSLRWWLVGGAALLLTLGALHAYLQQDRSLAIEAQLPQIADPATPPANPLQKLSNQIALVLKQSRPVLLGSRDPLGPSCVTPVMTGDIQQIPPTNPGDYNGGPGTTFATLYGLDRQNNNSPVKDYIWHQRRLKTFLENVATSNQVALESSAALHKLATALSDRIVACDTFPADLKPVETTDDSNWLSYCFTAMNKAVSDKNLVQAKHWACELKAATFSLQDLHRWLGFLTENYLTALAFQNQCETLFSQAEALKKPYDPNSTISNFPAGVLCLNGFGNFYEVERQAERIFTMPKDRLDALAANDQFSDGSQWVRPGVRAIFTKLRGALSSKNQATFDEAARTPFEHSYLINMLYRANHAETADYLCGVLIKFDANHPDASVGELMGVLMYRGHSFAGLEWADRFQPELLQAAAEIPATASDEDAFRLAVQWTHQFYQPALYGVTFTLRDALQQKRLDCVRATDMIGAIYRNAGRPRFGNVRWCSATRGHTVAAYLQRAGEKMEVLLGDGLRDTHELETWPNCYFHNHAWPPGFEAEAPAYAAELYIRGLDSYIWAEGYIIRGPNAGTQMVAGIPYSPTHTRSSTTKIFAGPYPL